MTNEEFEAKLEYDRALLRAKQRFEAGEIAWYRLRWTPEEGEVLILGPEKKAKGAEE